MCKNALFIQSRHSHKLLHSRGASLYIKYNPQAMRVFTHFLDEFSGLLICHICKGSGALTLSRSMYVKIDKHGLLQAVRLDSVFQESSVASRVHPSILQLGLKYADGSIAGGNARCLAMLLAFKTVIEASLL